MKDTGERLVVNQKSLNTNYFRHIIAYVFAEKYIKDKNVLDDGCGSGYGSYHLKSKGAKRVTGIDISEEAIEYAGKNYKNENLNFVQMDVTKLNFDDNTFDILTSFQVIEHIKDVNKYLAEIKRVLKNGGIALITTPNKQTSSPNTIKPENPFHVKEYYYDDFKNLLANYFGKVQIFGVNQSEKAEKIESSIKKPLKFLKKLHISFFVQLLPKKIKNLIVNTFYKDIGVSDFKVAEIDTNHTLDFIALCIVDK